MADRNKKLSASEFRDALTAQAKAIGFADIGIAPAHLDPSVGKRLRQWLDDGCHGDMVWMESRADQRAHPQTLWSDVRSVIMLGMSYAPPHDPLGDIHKQDNGLFSVYAQGGDYHKWVKKALKALARWIVENEARLPSESLGKGSPQIKVFVDTAPVMEKPLAQTSGLGWQGKHSNLVSKDHGSWLFLGAIYTNLELPADPAGQDHCGSCTACQSICPTSAFIEPYRLDARKCISYLTIEHDGPIAHHFRKPMGNRIYGCDDCLAICPWNKFADSAQRNRAFLPRAEFVLPDLHSLLTLTKSDFEVVFAGSAIKRIGRNRMVRNACIAAGNSGNHTLLPNLTLLLTDESAMVRGAAIWALWQIDPQHTLALKEKWGEQEQDGSVLAEWQQTCPSAAELAA